MSQLRQQPVSRPKVVAGALALLLLLAGIVALSEWLRPAAREHPPDPPEAAGDPRDEVVCPEPAPREGQPETSMRNGGAPPVEVTSNALYDCPSTWHGRAVRYVGEAVGGVLQRGEHAWIQLNDDIYAHGPGPLPAHRDFRGGNAGVGVLIPAEHVGVIDMVGGPWTHGDLVEVVGTFHRLDEATGEAAVIRAGEVRVLRPGRATPPRTDPLRVWVAVALGGTAGGLLVLQWVVRRRRLR